MKRAIRSILSFLLCATGSVLFAQQPVNRSAPAQAMKAPAAPAAPPAPVVPPPPVATAPQLESQVKELQDQLNEKDIQITNLQMQLLNLQAGQVSATKQKAIADLQASHPGMRWDENAGRLMPIPPPPPPPAKPELPKK